MTQAEEKRQAGLLLVCPFCGCKPTLTVQPGPSYAGKSVDVFIQCEAGRCHVNPSIGKVNCLLRREAKNVFDEKPWDEAAGRAIKRAASRWNKRGKTTRHRGW